MADGTQPSGPGTPGERLIIVRQPDAEGEGPRESVEHPAKLLRIATMVRELVEEARQTKLDEQGRKRLQAIYERSVGELKDVLSDELSEELATLTVPFEETPSEAEIRVAQAQLLGWLEGLFHGIQAALWAQQMEARTALEQMRHRGLPAGQPRPAGRPPVENPEGTEPPSGPPGQYL